MEWYETDIFGSNISYLQLLFAFLVIISSILLGKLITISLHKFLKSFVSENSLNLLERIIYYSAISIGVLASLSYVGIDFTGVILAGGIVGIIIGFATQSVVSNLISGIFLQIDKPISIGDPVGLIDENIHGTILEINTLSTSIRTYDGVNLRIPNEKIFLSKIHLYQKYAARRAVVQVGIAYKENIQKAIDVITKTLDDNSLVLVEPSPKIYLDELGDSSLNLSVRAWAPSPVWFDLRSTMVHQIKNALDEAGIEIPFPQRVVWKGEN